MTDDFRNIRMEQTSGFARITLNRVEVHNAVDPLMLAEMRRAVAITEADTTVSALILTGAGDRAFCSGFDMRAFQEQGLAGAPLAPASRRFVQAHPLETVTKPVIAAVNGLAFGGGLELVLMCDIVIAADHATFAAKEVARGLMPGNGATQRLPRKIGMTRAMEMLLTAQTVEARRALEIGLVSRLVPSGDLADAAEAMAASIAANGPVAVRATKEAVLRGADIPLKNGLEVERDLCNLVHETADAKEGILAFLEKRRPDWKGR